MKGFFALLRLQLLSRLADFKPRNIRAQMREKKRKTIGMLFAYAFLAVYVVGFFGFLENELLTVLIGMGMPDLLLSMAVTMSMLSTLVLAFFFIMSTLYFGRDTAFLASLPITPRTILASKLTHVWISETGVSALLLFPASILYGVRLGEGALFYVRMLLVWVGVAVLPIMIVTFLSTLLIRLSSLWKKREMVATVGGIVLLIAYMFLCMNMGSVVGGDNAGEVLTSFFMNNQARILAITRFFPPAAWAARGLQGDWGQLALFLAVCACAAVFTVWALGKIYGKLSLLQGETPTRSRKSKKRADYTGGSAFKACCKREIRQILRVPAYATNILPITFMPTLMVAMMAISLGRAFSEEGGTLASMLSDVNGAIVLAAMAGMMSFMAGMNPALSTAVTREGKGHDFLTALPVSPRTFVMAKMTIGFVLSFIGCIPAVIILMVLLPEYVIHACLAFVICLLYCYCTGAIALANDVVRPKLDWLTETEAIKQKSGTLIGILVGWAVLLLLGLVSYLLISHGASTAVYAVVLVVLLALGAYAAHRLLLRMADTKYCQG